MRFSFDAAERGASPLLRRMNPAPRPGRREREKKRHRGRKKQARRTRHVPATARRQLEPCPESVQRESDENMTLPCSSLLLLSLPVVAAAVARAPTRAAARCEQAACVQLLRWVRPQARAPVPLRRNETDLCCRSLHVQLADSSLSHTIAHWRVQRSSAPATGCARLNHAHVVGALAPHL